MALLQDEFVQRFEWWLMCDPGTVVSPFAVGFYALDRYSPYLFMVDEIYETIPENTTTGYICPRIIEKCLKYTGDLAVWKKYYDSAAPWFAVDAKKRFDLALAPVEKKPGEKETQLNAVQELFLQRRFLISTNCPNAVWEFDNYFKDKKGNFIKKNDNHIDNTRYLIGLSQLVIEAQDLPESMRKRRNFKTPKYKSLDADRKERQKYDVVSRILKKPQYRA